MPEFIKDIIVVSIGLYIIFVVMGRKTNGKKIIRVPKLISFILFTPLEPGKVTLNVVLSMLCIILSLISGIIYYYTCDFEVSRNGYIIPLIIFLVISIIIEDKFKDND